MPAVTELSPEKLETRRARERMRYVEPENCGKILAHDRYWTRQFLERYLKRCDAALHDAPKDAYLLGDPLDELAGRIRVGPGAGDFDTEEEKASYKIRALALRAATRAWAPELGREEADLVFRRAFREASGRRVEPSAAAELHYRYAAHLTDREATKRRELLEQALDISREHEIRATYVDSLLLRGTLTPGPEGAIDLVEVLRLADQRSARMKRAFSTALRELTGMRLVHPRRLQAQEAAVLNLANVQERFKGQSQSRQKATLFWIEALLLRNLGVGRHAERKFEKCREMFRDLHQPMDFTLASLDLAWLLGEEERDAAADLCASTRAWLGDHCEDAELLEAVSEWEAGADLIALRERLSALRSQRESTRLR